MSEQQAKARIEAEFSDERRSPAANGDKTVDVSIPSAGIDTDDVRGIEYVEDVIDTGDQFRVYVSTESDKMVYST